MDDEDTHLWASSRLYELLREPQDTPLVAVIGSSGIVEAMTEERGRARWPAAALARAARQPRLFLHLPQS